MPVQKFEEMVGETIIARVPNLHPTTLQSLKLHGAENSGLWVESQVLTEQLLSMFGVPTAPKTPVFFLPFHQIAFVLGYADAPALSETAFGVKPRE